MGLPLSSGFTFPTDTLICGLFMVITMTCTSPLLLFPASNVSQETGSHTSVMSLSSCASNSLPSHGMASEKLSPQPSFGSLSLSASWNSMTSQNSLSQEQLTSVSSTESESFHLGSGTFAMFDHSSTAFPPGRQTSNIEFDTEEFAKQEVYNREESTSSTTVGASAGVTASMSSRLNEIEIPEYDYPSEFREFQYDVMLIYTPNHQILAEGFRYILENCITVHVSEDCLIILIIRIIKGAMAYR